MTDEYDVFISHASEDKDGFVRLLFEQLRDRGYRVWYDEFSLRMGDGLRRSIDYGLANSRYGIVVISPNFLRKEWPQRELDGLTAKEINGSKSILPIWYQVNRDDVLRYSPTLADRLAVAYNTQGMDIIVREIDKVLTASSNAPIVDLSSDRNVDYTKLCDLLKARQWEDADNETYSAMLKVVGREKGDWIRHIEISNFPCTDLRTIDSLWVHYSSGHFGFSVQKRIYLDVGRLNTFDERTWREFCVQVKWVVDDMLENRRGVWIKRSQVTFNQSAPQGHLPRVSLMHFNGRDVGVLIEKVECWRSACIILIFLVIPISPMFFGFNTTQGVIAIDLLLSILLCILFTVIYRYIDIRIMKKLGQRVVSLLSHPSL